MKIRVMMLSVIIACIAQYYSTNTTTVVHGPAREWTMLKCAINASVIRWEKICNNRTQSIYRNYPNFNQYWLMAVASMDSCTYRCADNNQLHNSQSFRIIPTKFVRAVLPDYIKCDPIFPVTRYGIKWRTTLTPSIRDDTSYNDKISFSIDGLTLYFNSSYHRNETIICDSINEYGDVYESIIFYVARYTVCDTNRMYCHNTGTCISDSTSTVSCICKLAYAGHRCDIDMSLVWISGVSTVAYIAVIIIYSILRKIRHRLILVSYT